MIKRYIADAMQTKLHDQLPYIIVNTVIWILHLIVNAFQIGSHNGRYGMMVMSPAISKFRFQLHSFLL